MSLETRILAAIQAIGADIKALFSNKQDVLVSGSNVKTVNGQSIVGAGNVDISGGSGGAASGFEQQFLLMGG